MDFSLASPADQARAARLRRMKAVSLSLLLGAAVVYLAIVLSRVDTSGGWGFVKTAAEAAMVGGLADWFAVTALFKHPLGIPIPHTAIIPRKKDDVARMLQDFLTENFLTEQIVAGRVLDAHPARRLGGWLQSPANAQRVVHEGARIGRAALGRVREEDVRSVATDAIIPRLSREPVAPHLGRLLDGVVQDNTHKGVVDLIVNETGRWLTANPNVFSSMVGDKAPRWAPSFLNERVAQWTYQQAVEWLVDVRNNPHHPARTALNDLLLRMAHDLQDDTAVQRKVEELKERLLNHPGVGDAAVGLWRNLSVSLGAAIDEPDSTLRRRASESIARTGAQLASDEALQAKVDRMAADAAAWVVKSYGRELTTVISHTIQNWDGELAARKIELAVGRDLQFIRINGTVVGALAGLAIHTVGYLVG